MTIRYYALIMKFRSPVHFGETGEGGDLSTSSFNCHSDTLFSALCTEAARINPDLTAKLANKAENGEILFSDLFPWHWSKTAKAPELFIKKPVIAGKFDTEQNPARVVETLNSAREMSGERKKIKKRLYIRPSEIDRFVASLKNQYSSDKQSINELSAVPEFAAENNNVHFNGRTRTPYDINCWHFAENCGLYAVCSIKDEKDLEWLSPIVTSLSLEGIGGKKSSGYGKFDLLTAAGQEHTAATPQDAFVALNALGEDGSCLVKYLNDDKSANQISLSALLPCEEEIQDAMENTGKLLHRSGFSYSVSDKSTLKTGSIYMIDSGACFHRRLRGRIAEVGLRFKLFSHPVYRYGKGLYIGIQA